MHVPASCCAATVVASVVAAAPVRGAGCAGESAQAVVAPGQTVTLNPGGGPDDPMDHALVVFTNGPQSEPATVTVCELPTNPNAGALGYDAYDRLLTLEVTFEMNDPESVDTFVARVSMPYDDSDVPVGPGLLGPEATELTYFNLATAWSLAVAGNLANSPTYAETVGDRTTVVGTSPPGAFSDQVGDYGVFWHTDDLRGFAWANVDQAHEFAPGAPICWADLTGDGPVDILDLLDFLGLGLGPCTDPVIACHGDIFVDGVIDIRDLAQLLAFFGSEGCFLPPDTAAIRHEVSAVDNSAGDAEWGAGAAGFTHLTWDLRVFLDPDDIDDWWTTTEAVAELDDPAYGALTFYQHPSDSFWEGTGGPAAAPFSTWCNFPNFEAAPFDTYVIEATDVNPCTTGGNSGAFVGAGYTETPTMVHATWYDGGDFAPPGAGAPPFTIARYTILVDRADADCPACHLDLDVVQAGTSPDPAIGSIGVVTTHRFGLSNLIPFSFDIVDFCAADVDDSGHVSTADLLELLADWGMFGVRADVNRDGTVSTADLLMVLSRWGSCS